MQVILKPRTHPQLGDIVIHDNLFAVGRHESPFDSYDRRLVAQLSTRHARIFEESGAVFLADVGSLNGTTHNGQRVAEQPVRLQPHDEICFAGRLCYQLHILGQGAGGDVQPTRSPAPLRLTLIPTVRDGSLDSIVVTEFPFLIGRKADAFTKYRDRYPDEVRYISGRHAHIFLRDGQPWIEDLGSTNGTFVGSARLDEHTRRLQHGDIIAFGGNHFVYTAWLDQRSEQTIAGTEEPATGKSEISFVLDDPKTTYVSSATSFIDIFCGSPDGDEEVVSGAEQGLAAGGDEGAERTYRRDSTELLNQGGLLRRIRVFLGELRTAFGNEGRSSARPAWTLGVIALISVAAGTAYFQWGTQERELRRLLEAGNHADAVILADTLLARTPADESLRGLASAALIKHVAANWPPLIEARQFDQADAFLSDAARLSRANPDGLAMIEALQWVGRMQRSEAQRGTAGAIAIFGDGEAIAALTEWWEQDPAARRHTLQRIAGHAPQLDTIHARTFSYLYRLRSEKSLYLAAIERLKADIGQGLHSGDLAAVRAGIEEFRKTYPSVQGSGDLIDDLNRYETIRVHIDGRELLQALQRLEQEEFKTPTFRHIAATSLAQLLPPREVADRFREAAAAWQQGDLDNALALTETLTKEPWGDVAAAMLERYRRIRSDFAAIESGKGDGDNGHLLLAVAAELDPKADAFLYGQLKPELERHRALTLESAEQALDHAARRWKEYRDLGGIRGALRLEDEISAAYRTRAKLLMEAHDYAGRALRLANQLAIELPAENGRLHDEIAAEQRRQRQSLVELSMVLDQKLLEAKLRMLSAPTETNRDRTQ